MQETRDDHLKEFHCICVSIGSTPNADGRVVMHEISQPGDVCGKLPSLLIHLQGVFLIEIGRE